MKQAVMIRVRAHDWCTCRVSSRNYSVGYNWKGRGNLYNLYSSMEAKKCTSFGPHLLSVDLPLLAERPSPLAEKYTSASGVSLCEYEMHFRH